MQTFPPRTLDAILQVGRSALTSVKDLPLDPIKEKLLLSNYFHTHNASACKNILLSQAHGFAYFDGADGTLRQVICPKQVGPNLYWASANDRYESPTPVAFSLDALGSSVISIARDELARECKARHIQDTQYSPHTALAPDSANPPEDIYWPSGDGVFTEVKKFFPIYPGAPIPTNLKLSSAPPADLDTFHPQFQLWYEAMKYLHDHNESQSIHSHDHIFSDDTIPTDRFPSSDLATHLTYSTSDVSAFAAEADTYKNLFEEFKRHSALSTLASTTHVATHEVPAAPLPAGAPFDSELFAQIMANALKGVNASTKEKDLARTSASAKDSYRLLFGRVKSVVQLDGSTVKELHPSVLSDDFETFLEIGSIKEALRHLHDTFAHITDTLTTRNNYDRNVDFDIALFQHATVTALKTCSFGFKPLTMHPHEATSLLSLLAWLPPNKHDVKYTTFLAEGRDIIRQEAMEEDKSKQAAKKTDIFVHGDISSVEALIKMLANFFAFAKYCVKDFTFDDPPLIVTLLEDFMDALHTPTAKDWIRWNDKVPHLPLCLLLEMNQILQIVVGVSKNKTTLSKLRNGQPITIDTFVNAFNGVESAIGHLNMSITMGNLGPYATCPNLHTILHGKPNPAPKREGPTTRERPDPTKRARPQPLGSHPGYLTYDGPGRLPIAPFKCKHPITGKQAAFCSHFLFANYHCTRPRCHNIHYTKQFAATMSPTETQSFDKFIEKTPGVTRTAPKPHVPQCSTCIVRTPRSMIRNPINNSLSPPHPSRTTSTSTQPTGTLSNAPSHTPSSSPPSASSPDSRIHGTLTQNKKNSAKDLKLRSKVVPLSLQRPNATVKLGQQQNSRPLCSSPSILPMSRYLSPTDMATLFQVCPSIHLLSLLLDEHRFVDFRPLRQPIPTHLPPDVAMHRWSRMFTACLLHYDLSIPTAVRFVGNIHTGAHRDWPTLEPILREAKVDPLLITQLKRIFLDGAPNYVTAESSDENLRTFIAYGNHKTVYDDVKKTKSAVEKDVLRNYLLAANPALLPYIRDAHTTPLGLVDASHEYRKPRIIFDATHHPSLAAMAVNDFTSKDTEPDICFPRSFPNFLIWIYNLRITYPNEEIYICDDDVSGAFRHVKWNPNVVGMHMFMLFGFLFFCTGLSFGDNTSPAQWEVVALVRQQLAQSLWYAAATTIPRVAKYLPPLSLAPLPTPSDIAAFTPAEPDSKNPGVLQPDGTRKSPTFDHHVDDCLYADVALFLRQTISASVLALYILLGYPNTSNGIRDCISWEKFANTFSHERKTIGWVVNSRQLTVSLPPIKRDRLLKLLSETLANPKLSLRDIAILLGHVSTATTVCRWMRCSYFNLQRVLSQFLRSRHQSIKHYMKRNDKVQIISDQLPPALSYRLASLIGKEAATFLWNANKRFHLDASVTRELRAIQHSLKTEPWKIYIPQMIPRDPHFTSFGDASFIGGGAYSEELLFWFRIVWSPDIVAGTKLKSSNPNYVHINSLEFLVAFLQEVATVVRLEGTSHAHAGLVHQFPNGFPHFPVLLNRTDNTPTEKWMNDARTNSPFARLLVDLHGQLLKRSPLTSLSDHVPDISHFTLDEKLRLFPAESRTLLRPALLSILQSKAGAADDPRKFGTLRSRRLHFLKFCYDMNLRDDYLMNGPDFPHERRVATFALYTVALATGRTLQGQYIKSATIKQYLHAAASFICLFTGRDPRYNNPSDTKMSPDIHATLAEVERHEKVPNKLEPYTLDMQQHLEQHNLDTKAHHDGIWKTGRVLTPSNQSAVLTSYFQCRHLTTMGSATNRLMGAFAVVLLLLVSINMKVLSMNAVYDLKERMGDNVMENFKILPANRLVHVSRAGIGHRMVRDTSAYHLAKGLDLARLKLQWGSCSKDTNWKGNEGFDELSIFPHLFGNDLWNVPGTLSGPKREGKKVIARNDVYGYIPGESYKTYHIPIQREIYEGEDGPFFDKLQSDSEFYDKLVDSYMFKDEVEAFMEEHNFAEHEVIGIHLSAGNGEEKHKIEDERKFMKNILYLVSQYVRLMKMLYHDRFARRTPLIFLATDTPRLIPEVQAATEKFGVKTVVLDQIRVEDNEGVTYKALAGKEETCLEGWKAMTSDMMLLSHSDVVIAARPSAFTQGLPLSRVFDKHVDEEGPHYCEVGDDGNYMSCLEDKKTWLFRDNIRKVVPISRSQGINGLFDPEFPQVVHNLLIQLPDVVHPNEFQEVKKFLDGKRGENQGDILKHVYGEKAIFGKYKDNLKHEPKWNFED